MATKKNKASMRISDWSSLPEELLHIISKKLEDHCFDVIHARSVCSYWRYSFAFPSCLLRQTYSLPPLPLSENEELCTLKKSSMFLFRVHTLPIVAMLPSEFFLGSIVRDDHMELLPSPSQCSVKVKISGSDPTLMNMLDCQILPLGHQYRINVGDHKNERRVAFLPLNQDEGEGGFVVILNYFNGLLALTSAEMEWKYLDNVSNGVCISLVAFKGRFYATFSYGEVVVISPDLLVMTPLEPSLDTINYLVPSHNDELFLVSLVYGQLCRVSRLDEETGKWIKVKDLEDRVLFIGHLGNFSCSAMELPHGCGVSGNSILFTSESSVDLFCKSIKSAGSTDEDLERCWTFSKEKRMTVLSSSSVLALRVVC